MPGREQAADETFDGDLVGLARGLAAAAVERLGPAAGPALVGHSFGSILAYEVALELSRLGVRPHRLVVQSFPPPDLARHEIKLHTLDDAELVREMDERFGGIPADIRDDSDALAYFVPTLRFDLKLLEDYAPANEPPRFEVPITAICGTDDRAVDLAAMHGWSRYTEQPLRLRAMPGDHFFPLARIDQVLAVATWGQPPAG
jgi:surfactin synthase thioesterase subunit